MTLQFHLKVGNLPPELLVKEVGAHLLPAKSARRSKEISLAELPSRLLGHIMNDEEAQQAFIRAVFFDWVKDRQEALLNLLNEDADVHDDEKTALLKDLLGANFYGNDISDVVWSRLNKLARVETASFRKAVSGGWFGMVGPLEPLKLAVTIGLVETQVEEV